MLEALILGFVQGLTEFLPISSSAHLRILGEFLPGAQDPGAAFTAITQLGTETAVVVFFWRDIVRIVSHWFGSLFGRVPRSDPDARMGWLIIVGSIPIVVLGILFQDEIETTFRSLWIVATMLVVFGIILGLADWAGAKRRKLDQLTDPARHRRSGSPRRSRSSPASRARAAPSRPGSSSATSAPRRPATRSCWRSPPSSAAGFFQLVRRAWGSPPVYGPIETAAATLVAFVVAILVIAFFMNYISRHSFLPFVIYRILLGGTIFALLATGVIDA